MIVHGASRNPVHYFGRSALEKLPSDALGEIVGALDLDTLINVMAISKLVRQRLEEPSVRPGLARHVPEIYRTRPMLVEMIQKVWQSMGGMILECPKIEVSAGRSPKTPEYLNESLLYDEYRRPIREFDDPMRSRLLKVLKGRLEKWNEALQRSDLAPDTNSVPQDMIIDCIAIETLLVNYRVPVPSGEEIHHFEHMCRWNTLITLLLRLKEYFSPKLFRILLQECRFHLLNAFFSSLDKCDDEEENKEQNKEQNKELARFLLKNCDGFSLGLSKRDCAKIENLLGVEFEELSIEYEIFGSPGLDETDFFGDDHYEFQSLCSRAIDQTAPLAKDCEVEECYEFVQHLVRVGKYVFTNAGELKHFILWVSREACKTVFLKGRRQEGWDDHHYYVELCQEATIRLENMIGGIVTRAIADDTTPFCAHPEFEHNTKFYTKFVYGVLGPYLVNVCVDGD